MIQTNDAWYSFLKSYEVDVAEYEGTCINSTEGGAYINGTVVMPFKDSIDKYLQAEFDPLAVIHQNITKFSIEDVKRDIEKVRSIADETITDMQNIVALCTDGVRICQEYKEELEAILRETVFSETTASRLKEIEQAVFQPQEKCLALRDTMQLFFAHVFQSFAIKHKMELVAIPEKYDNMNQSLAEAYLRQIEWYAVIGDLGNICLQSLKKARANMDSLLKQ
jgi:hypothetical protein